MLLTYSMHTKQPLMQPPILMGSTWTINLLAMTLACSHQLYSYSQIIVICSVATLHIIKIKLES